MNQVALTQGQAVSSDDGSISVPIGNRATLQPLDLAVAQEGIQTAHLAPKAVTEDKIGTNKASGLVLTSNGEGGAEFKTLGQVIGDNGKPIVGSASIEVQGGDHAALADVTLDVVTGGITADKLATDAVTTAKIKNQAVTAAKISGAGARQLLGTDASGVVKWMDANDQILIEILSSNEKPTVLTDHNDGTFTYFNENQVDNQGNVKPNAVGVTFNANTLSIDSSTPGIYIFKDKASDTPLATINTRAKSIIFDNSTIEYTNVEEAVTEITARIEALEELEIDKAPLSGDGILINGNPSEADAVFKALELSIANEAVTTAKMKGGAAKQILVTNDAGKAQWVDATDAIIEDIVHTQERITLLQDNGNGSFTYFNENDVDQNGTIIGTGIPFDANTLRINTTESGVYEFYDKATDQPLAIIDVEADIIEKISEILTDINVKQEIFNTVATQGKTVAHDGSIVVVGGEKAALNEMTISLKNQGVTTAKIKDLAVTEDKLFAGTGKESFIPVVQGDGSVKYQPMTAVVQGKNLGVDSSLELSGDGSKAVLQKIDLKVKEDGIGSEHIQSHAVTAAKIGTTGAELGAVLTADGSGNAAFVAVDEAIGTAMNGDVVGSTAIHIEGGENVLFGDENKKVVVKIKDGGVKGTHIAAETIKNLNLADATIEAGKLTAGTGVNNRVAVANTQGTVSYQALSTDLLTQKGTIHSDGTISVTEDGVDKVLADVTLGIHDTSIKATKLHGGNATPGAVATVGANGVTVSYQPLTASLITNKGTIATDGIVTVDNGVDKVLANLKLGIKEKGITTAQLADGAVQNAQLATQSVTTDKISAEGISAASVLVTRGDGEVVWGELGDIVTDTAGNLTTDDIITLTGGDGTNTLLKDVTLGIANQSITRDKLSSKENGANVQADRLLVTDGEGGFDYVLKDAVQAGGEDLLLGSALTFTNNTNGLNVVLAPTSIDVKEGGITTGKLQDGAVTVAKMSAGTAAENSVLTAQANGTVAYKELNSTVFDGEGAALSADESITVTADNKALLEATTIAVAEEGINTQHLKANAVTAAKISSKVNNTNAANGAILTADGSGNTAFQSLQTLATTHGKAITATDGSIEVADNKAALQELNLAIAEGGVKTTHLAARNVTADKIGSQDKEEGLILITDGQGGAEFQNLNDVVSEVGKTLGGGTGITITGAGAAHALLGDATVNIKDGGVNEMQLADDAVTTRKIAKKNVTIEKMSSKSGDSNTPAGQVLASDGRGGIVFASGGNTTSGELKGSVSINVTNGIGAALQDATITVKEKGIKAAQLDDDAVTTEKIIDAAITTSKIENSAIKSNKIDSNAVESSHIASDAIIQRTIANNAVTTDKINNLAVTNAKIANATITGGKLENATIQTEKLANGAVTTEKISAGNAQRGHVLTVESNGQVAFKAPTGQDISKGDLKGDASIDVQYGEDAVLRDVNIKVKDFGIKSQHLAGGAVGSGELADDAVDSEHIKSNAVETKHIEDKAVTAEKISSVDEDDDDTPEGYVLTSDGNGGSEFRPASATEKAAMPKFFYAPSFYVTVVPGQRNVSYNVYNIYSEQFGSPKVKNSGAGSATLPVLQANELNYFILYYDEDVLYDVEISDDGNLTYSVDDDVEVNVDTYFNIVFGVKEE
ncbi:beta strand repeat-containing protein [Myroides sp. DW712]|uniref:beta strand repeat-containing protein n=1 Tax=Myroides sp. DW712 TaxID=3389800 RepID=UPI003978A33A